MLTGFTVRNIRLMAVAALAIFALSSVFAQETYAQGSATNDMGNGGIHRVQGRIYIQNGRRADVTGLRIRLINYASNDLTVIADGTGGFQFRNLVSGSYTVRIEGGEDFEDVQESVVIDDPGSSNLSQTVRLRGGSKIASVQIFLKPKAGSPLAAAGVINARLAAVPKPARELYEDAQASIKAKDLPKAIVQLREALSRYREFSLAWNDLGVLLQNTTDTKGAVEAFRFAVKYDPRSPAANLNLGCALYNENAYAEAERYLIEALVASPNSYRGHYYMGLTQLRLGRMDVAEQAFRKAIDVGDEQAGMAHYMLGGIYWSAKKYREAAKELETYLKLQPNAADAEKTRASIAELKNKNE